MTGSALLADIGGTNARFAVWQDGIVGQVLTLPVRDYATVDAALVAVVTNLKIRPRRAFLAAAGPVIDDRIAVTNSPWLLDRMSLQASFNLDQVVLLNDFAALAHALPALTPADLTPLGGGAATADTRLVLGPGTGFGVAAITAHNDAVIGEGGHASLMAETEREAAVLARLRPRFTHVSIERVLSGPGLALLHQTLCALDGIATSDHDAAHIVGDRTPDCPACHDALTLFAGWLGAVAGDLALTFGARGGVYLAGGIAPRLGDRLKTLGFRQRFVAKGRQESYLAAIPIWIIRHADPAFLGLARLAAA